MVDYLALQRQLAASRKLNLETNVFTHGDDRERFDIASAETNIAQARGIFARMTLAECFEWQRYALISTLFRHHLNPWQ